MKDLYQTLGVATEASPKEITKAYRTLALKAHPDRGGDAEIMRLLNEAYDTLSDSDKRRAFDANWQAFQQTDVGQEVDIVCAGFLQPGNIRPYSHIFKAEHSSLVRLYEQTPLTKRNKLENPSSFESNLYRSEDQSEPIQYYHDIFSFIRSKKSLKNEPPSLDLPAFSKPLTPAIAIQLFIGFLSGYSYQSKLTKLTTYLTSEFNNITSKTPQASELILYEGIIDIILTTEKNISEQKNIIFSIKKITDFAKNTSDSILQSITPLLYNKFFRNLHAYSLHTYWHSNHNVFELEEINQYDGYIDAKDLLNALKERLIRNSANENLSQLIQYIRPKLPLNYNYKRQVCVKFI